MPSLYEIEQAMLDCLDLETGEVIDPAQLDALQMERDKKLESVALWIKNLESDVEAYKAEMEAFAARRKAAERKIEGLKTYLANALGGNKFSTAKCDVSFRKSEAVMIADEFDVRWWAEENKQFDILTVQPPKISLSTLKKVLKEGEVIPGAVLVERNNINIK